MAVLLSSAQPCRLKEFTERILPFNSPSSSSRRAVDWVSRPRTQFQWERPSLLMRNSPLQGMGQLECRGKMWSRPRVLQCGAQMATPAAPSCWERCRISQNQKLGVRPWVCSEQAFQVILMQTTARLEARKNIWTFCKCSMIHGSLRETQTLAEQQ